MTGGQDPRRARMAETAASAPLPQARRPAPMPAAAVVAIIWAVALIGIAVVAGREFLITRQVVPGPKWIENAANWVGTVRWENWMYGPTIGCLVAGAALLVVAIKPRARRYLEVSSATGVWTTATDVARMCTGRALSVSGVADASTVVTRRKVVLVVIAEPHGGSANSADGIRERVEHAVAPGLALLASPPRLVVNVKPASARGRR
jgi:hypothetical protein